MPFNDIIKDIKDQELCATAEHQKILVEELIEKVIEGKENERLQLAKFFLDLIDNIKNMNFLTMWVKVKRCDQQKWCKCYFKNFLIICLVFRSTSSPKLKMTVWRIVPNSGNISGKSPVNKICH